VATEWPRVHRSTGCLCVEVRCFVTAFTFSSVYGANLCAVVFEMVVRSVSMSTVIKEQIYGTIPLIRLYRCTVLSVVNLINTPANAHIFIYLLTYLHHGAESFLRS